MRILHLILSLAGGGAERQLAHLASALGARDHDVHVAYVFPGPNAERLAGGPCTLHHLAAAGRWRPLLPGQVVSLLGSVRPDVLHTWLAHMDIAGGAASRLLRVPWTMSERSAALSYPSTLMNRARVALGRRADMIVPNSAGGAEYWASRGADPARIEIVPNFVPAEEIESAPPLRDARLSGHEELIVHVGRLSFEKNLPQLIDAFRSVAQTRPRARLALCGDGAMDAQLRAQAEALGLNDKVIFTGFVSNVASWLTRAQVSVAVSRCEGHPNAVLESIAAGVPLVVSDIAAYRAILDDGAALFAAEGDPAATAAALIRALEDRGAAEGRAARARAVLAPLSLPAIAERYESVYRRAIESK